MRQSNVGMIRRSVAIAAAAVALLALAAQPAFAAEGYISMERPFELTGDRNHLRMDGRIVDSAPGSGINFGFNFGAHEGGSAQSVALFQNGTTLASRKMAFTGYGLYKGVSGPGCTYTPMTSTFGILECDNEGYDWRTDRMYRMTVVRGAKNTNGWLWTVNLVDTKPNPVVVTKVVSFRSSFGLLSAQHSGAGVFSNQPNCNAIDRVEALFRKPVGAGSVVTWKAAKPPYKSGCTAAKATATLLDNGVAKFVIGQ